MCDNPVRRPSARPRIVVELFLLVEGICTTKLYSIYRGSSAEILQVLQFGGLRDPDEIFIPTQFRLEPRLDVLGLPPPVSLTLEQNILDLLAPLLQRMQDKLGLGRRNDRIFRSLEDLHAPQSTPIHETPETIQRKNLTYQQRGVDLIHMTDRRPLLIHLRNLLIPPPDQPIQILTLELVRVLRKPPQIRDSIQRRRSGPLEFWRSISGWVGDRG